MTDATRRRQTREPFAKALHTPTLVIDAHDESGRTHGVNIRDELLQLRGVGVIACKKNHAADKRMLQQLALQRLQHRPLEIDHQRSERHRSTSRTAIDSTCVVCGNISTTPAAVSR